MLRLLACSYFFIRLLLSKTQTMFSQRSLKERLKHKTFLKSALLISTCATLNRNEKEARLIQPDEVYDLLFATVPCFNGGDDDVDDADDDDDAMAMGKD